MIRLRNPLASGLLPRTLRAAGLLCVAGVLVFGSFAFADPQAGPTVGPNVSPPSGSFGDWFYQSVANGAPVHFSVLVARLSIALLLGCGVAGIYWWTQSRDRQVTVSFTSTLVMLAVLMAIVTQVVGENFALAFSLVGALSIVRFRTVVEDTRDTAFVIFAVVIGMAVGAGFFVVALAGIVAGALAALAIRSRKRGNGSPAFEWTMSLRISAGMNPNEILAGVANHFRESLLVETSTGRQGAALDLRYRVRLAPGSDPTTVVADLNRIEGVQSVELKRS